MRWDIAVPAIIYVVYRAYSHKSLTPLGCLTAALTATIHALHPSPVPFTLLLTFFILGTTATKVKAEAKATLTLNSTGSHARGPSSTALGDVFSGGWNKTKQFQEQKQKAASKNGSGSAAAGGQEPRSTTQVLANSACATILCLCHTFLYGTTGEEEMYFCFGAGSNRTIDAILLGIMANYAVTAADTLSSELGILSKSKPRFILQPWKTVPPGTNGGVTAVGLFAGFAGAGIVGAVSALLLPRPCSGELADQIKLVVATAVWGLLGSMLDSVLGAALQASVIDRRSGKVVEAPNGGRVKVVAQKSKVEDASEKSNPSRIIGSGVDILDNNQVNFLMASTMTIGAIVLARIVWP